MKYFFVFLSVGLIVLSGCAESYRGSGPQLDVQTEPAKQEQYLRYRLAERNFLIQGNSSAMDNHEYTLRSLRPFTQSISPRSEDKFKTADYLFYSGLGMAATAVGLLAAGGASESTGLMVAGFGALSMEITLFMMGSYKISTGIRYYNEDLRSKFGVKNP